jgi:hypothetical protein
MDGAYYTSGLVYDGVVTCVQQPTLVVTVSKTAYAKVNATDVFYYGSMSPVIGASGTQPEVCYQGLGAVYMRAQACGPVTDKKMTVLPANSGSGHTAPLSRAEIPIWYNSVLYGANIFTSAEKVCTLYELFAPLDGVNTTYAYSPGSAPLSADRFTTGSFKSGYFIPSATPSVGIGYVNGNIGLIANVNNGTTSWASFTTGLYRVHRPFDPTQPTNYWRTIYGTGFTGASPWTYTLYDTAFEAAPVVSVGTGNFWFGRGGATTMGLSKFDTSVDPSNVHFQMTTFDDATLNAFLLAGSVVVQASPYGFILSKASNYAGISGVAKYGDFILVSPDAKKWWAVKVNVTNFTNGTYLPNQWSIDNFGILYGICITTSGVTDVWSSYPLSGPYPWITSTVQIGPLAPVVIPCVSGCRPYKLQAGVM